MKRREFLNTSFRGLAMLGGAQIFASISSDHYTRLLQDGTACRFAVASDGHYGQSETTFDTFHTDMMTWLNAHHTESPLNFTFFNGDLIHDDPSLYDGLKNQYAKLQMPYYVSRGNHDRCSADLWKSTWNMDLNYTFEIQDNAFVVLDTSNSKGEYICPDLEWTADALHKYRSHRNVFVFMHITPLKWTKNGISCQKLVKLFSKQKNLRAIFHGHDHDQDAIKISKGKCYLFDSHIGGNWGTDYRGYRVVEITKSNEIVTYQLNPAMDQRVNSSTLHTAKA
jgi:3',5'-cyclic-AMP phosphodiesterase